ncbi:hypothetical protein, partial [Nostoc sp.]|uniref:hypothetical protein n=1 Tax=Nostoc sp. TaxID=1180 RepID=UPI002FF6D5BF
RVSAYVQRSRSSAKGKKLFPVYAQTALAVAIDELQNAELRHHKKFLLPVSCLTSLREAAPTTTLSDHLPGC